MEGVAPGRVVHYVIDDGIIRPAIIARVENSEGVASLWQFTVPPEDQTGAATKWRPDVPYSEVHKPGTWHFPPRV